MSSQSAADFVTHFARVVKSNVSTETGAVLYSVAGVGPLLGIDTGNDLDGEVDEDQGVFSALGFLARPLPPETVGNQVHAAEVLCIRVADGLIPISARDTRIRLPGTAPNEGAIAFAGYGGGFHILDPVDEGASGTIHVIYCPYAFTDPTDPGTAAKAHSITIDPTSGNESIMIVHADGPSVILKTDSLILRNAAGDVYIELNDTEAVVNANMKVLGGFQTLDPTGTLSFPLAKSAELITWAIALGVWQAQVTTAVNGLAPGSITAPVVPLPGSVATTNTFGF